MDQEVVNPVSFHSSYTIMGNTMANSMDVPKGLKGHQSFGAQPNWMKMGNIIMVNTMNIMVIVHQIVQLNMIVLGIHGVLGLLVQKLVELELLKDQELFSRMLNQMARNVPMRMPFKANIATSNPVQFANGVSGPTGQIVREAQGADIEKEVKLVPKILKFKQNSVHYLQFIANGAYGEVGVLAPKPVMMECNKE